MKHLIATMLVLQTVLPIQVVMAEQTTTESNPLTLVSIDSTQTMDNAYDAMDETTVSFTAEDTMVFSNNSETKKQITFTPAEAEEAVYHVLIEELAPTGETSTPVEPVSEQPADEINLSPLSAILLNETPSMDEEGNEMVEYIFEKGTEWDETFTLEAVDVEFSQLEEIQIASIEEIVLPTEEVVSEEPVVEETVQSSEPATEKTTEPVLAEEPKTAQKQSFSAMSVQPMSLGTFDYTNGLFDTDPTISTTNTTAAPLNLLNLKDNDMATYTTLTTSYNSFFTEFEVPMEIKGIYLNTNATADTNVRVRVLANGAYTTIATVSTKENYIDLSASSIQGKKVSRFTVDRVTVSGPTMPIYVYEVDFDRAETWSFPAKDAELQTAFKPINTADRVIPITDAGFKGCLNNAIGQDAAADITKSQADALSGVLDCSDQGVLTLEGTGGFQTRVRDITVSYAFEPNLNNAVFYLITENGTLYAWGYNAEGQIGNGTRTAVSTPTAINFGGAKIRKVASSGYGVLAIDESFKIWSWGAGSKGGLGHGDQNDQLTPKRISAISGNVIDIATFGSVVDNQVTTTSYAVVENGSTGLGTLYAWGNDASGQAGVGPDSLNFYTSPQVVKRASGIPLTDIATVSAGASFAGAIDKWGRVWMWGNGSDGKLGQGNTANSISAIPVTAAPTIKKIALGNLSTHAITKDGTLYAWGQNAWAQIGDGTTSVSSLPKNISALYPELTSVKDVRTGLFTTLALTESGNVYAWGYNGFNQVDSSSNSRVNTPSLQGTGATAIFAGSRNTGFIKPDQIIYIAGNNLDGQLLDTKSLTTANHPTGVYRGLMRFLGINITGIDLSGNTGIDLTGTKGMSKLTDIQLNNTKLTDFSLLSVTNVKNIEVKNNDLMDLNGLSSLKYLESVDASNNLLITEDIVTLPNGAVLTVDNNFLDNGNAASYTDPSNTQYNFALETVGTTEESATYEMIWTHQGTEVNAQTVIEPIIGDMTGTSTLGNQVVKTWNTETNRYNFIVNKQAAGEDTLTISMVNGYQKSTALEFFSFEFVVDPYTGGPVEIELGEETTFALPGFEVIDTSGNKNWSVGITSKAVNTSVSTENGFELADTFQVSIDTQGATMSGVGAVPNQESLLSTISVPLNTVLYNEDGSPKTFQVIYAYEITVAE